MKNLKKSVISNGFSLVEVLIIMTLLFVALAANVAFMTQRSSKDGIDANVLGCIMNNAADIVFNATTGNITGFPTSGNCYGAYYGCQQGKDTTCNTIFSFADGFNNRTNNQRTAALKILRASCDKGGSKACQYFISRCVGNMTTNCTSPDANLTFRFYDKMLTTDSLNNGQTGRSYIETTSNIYAVNWNITTFNNELNTICPGCPSGNATTGCRIKGCY